MQNHSASKVHTNATEACVHIQNLANTLQNTFEYDQIKTKIFGLKKNEATKPLKREKGKKP